MSGGSVVIVNPFPLFGAVEDYGLILARGAVSRGWSATVIVPAELELPAGLADGIDLLALEHAQLHRPRAFRSAVRGLPHVDVLHVNHAFLPAMSGGLGARVAPLVVTEHTPALDVCYAPWARALERLLAPRMAAWVVLSERNRTIQASRFPRAALRIHVIPPGLPPERFRRVGRREARVSLGLAENAFVVGAVGRLARQKRHDILVRAAALAAADLPDLLLVVVGDGELRGEVEAQAGDVLGDRAVFTGHRSDVPSLLPAFDVFCLTSDYEGLPFAVLEAMATGLPIVATDVQGTGEAIRDGVDGLLVARGDARVVAAAIVRLARDPELASGLGTSARARFEQEYVSGLMVDRTLALYEAVAWRRRGR